MLPLAGKKLKSLATANDTNPYNTCVWNAVRNFTKLHIGLANKVCTYVAASLVTDTQIHTYTEPLL